MYRFLLVVFALFSSGALLIAQDGIESDAASGEQVVSEGSQAAVVADEVEPSLSPLEFVTKLVGSEPDSQFLMLPKVTPRGVGVEEKAEMVQLLIPLLQSEYPDIRARTASAIGLFGPDAKNAIPALLEHIGDNAQTIHLATVWSLVSKAVAKIGPAALGPCIEKLPAAKDIEFYGLSAVIADLGEQDEARAMAPFFLEQVKEGPERHKWAAIYSLSKLGDAAKPAIPELIKQLDHDKFNIQVIACRALAELGPAAKPAVPRLLKLTEKEGNMLSARTHAAMCLGSIGAEATETDLVSVFKSMISENNAFSQERGLIALGRLGAHGKDAESFVAALLDNTEFSQRPEAALALWKISGNAERTAELLRPMMVDKTYDSRTFEAIKEMGPAAAPLAEELAGLLQTDDSSLQLTIAEIFEAMGPAAKPQLDRLRPLPDSAPPDIAVQLDEIIANMETLQ